ncbi:MAG: hypothetical protein SynsKO_30160 [Synoicihabitans sp.]
MSFPSFPRPLLGGIIFLTIFAVAGAARWREITPEEFAQSEPKVDPDFGAEILFSEATLEQEWNEGGTYGSFEYYTRIKVFNEQGVEEVSRIELTYAKGREIRSVSGRTVKPDGTVVPLEKDSIFDQAVVRKGRTNVRATTFAFSNLEPGDIVELQYRKNTGDEAYVIGMDFQGELPSQRVFRSIRPFSVEGIGDKILKFQLPDVELKKNRKGAYEFELFDVPAKVDEPFALPEVHLGPYIMVYYFNFEPRLKTYWRERAKELSSEGRSKMKVSSAIKDFVRKETADISDPREKLRKLYHWCQSEPTNLRYSYGIYTQSERKALKENFTPQDTFSREYGTPKNINSLFGAMAKSLGMEVQFASTNDVRDMLFNENVKAFFALADECVAIRLNGEWEFFNPGGSPFLPFDSIPWWACGSKALVGNAKNDPLHDVPMPTADYSITHREGNFTIDESGTLSGIVQIRLQGFTDLDMKEALSSRHTEEDEEEYIIQDLKEQLPNMDATDFKIRNRGSRNAMAITFNIEVPEFADVTGKRLFIQPAVFQKNASPLFTADKRQGGILFPYPVTEQDIITIKVPDDFKLEAGSAPRPLDLGSLGSYETKLGITKSNRIKYSRTFKNNLRLVDQKYYDPIKAVFELVNQTDQHTLTFKRVEAE